MNTRQKLIVTPEQFAEGYVEVTKVLDYTIRSGKTSSIVMEKRQYELIQKLPDGNLLVSRPMLPECVYGPARD